MVYKHYKSSYWVKFQVPELQQTGEQRIPKFITPKIIKILHIVIASNKFHSRKGEGTDKADQNFIQDSKME